MATQPVPPTPSPGPPKKDDDPHWIWGFVALGLVIAFVWWIATSMNNDSGSTSPSKAEDSAAAPAAAEIAAPAVSTDPTTTEETTTTTPKQIDPDVVFIATLDAQNVRYSTKAAVINIAHTMCADLDNGYTVHGEELKLLTENQSIGVLWSSQDLGYMFGAAVSAYCPQYNAQLHAPS